MNALPPVREMERAYRKSDAAYEGLFFLGVRTTGIFCRPTCRARKPLPGNVQYFATAQAALAAGYRPCKRCRPLVDDDQPEWATRLLREVECAPQCRITDGQLRRRGLDPATVRRHFLKRVGMTFQAYCRARRLVEAQGRIANGGKLDDAVFQSGYESHSGFREAFARLVGVPPGTSKDRPGIVMAWLKSPLGPLVAGATARGVCLLEFTDGRKLATQLARLRKSRDAWLAPGRNEHLDCLKDELAGYFAGKLKAFSVSLDYAGTPFQTAVWRELLRIPYGATRSYQQLAQAVGAPAAVRAVGRANGDNRIAIVVPCHRVIGKNGQLVGYGGGLRRKQFLLNLEQSHAST